MVTMRVLLFLLGLVALISAKIYFKEEFLDDSWQQRWIQSKYKDDYGQFKLSTGKFFDDAVRDQGIKTMQDAKFYDLATKFPTFSNEGKTLVIQFTVKHEQGIDCGGGYIKVLPSTVDLDKFHGDSPYNVMFGPDICGYSKKVHVIFSYKGKNLLIKKEIRCKEDELTHMYTLVLKSDNSYEVLIDGEKVEEGQLKDDWDFLPPEKIKDPQVKKPEDWDDRKLIDDKDDKKPEDWDQPEHIKDPEAKKPEDWDDQMDGDWEAPMIPNPMFKGDWKPKQIENPNYKGEWIHPEINNPEFVPDEKLYLYEDWGGVGIDVWQVKSGSIFDNIIITDSVEEAKEFADQTFHKQKVTEKKLKDKEEEEERKKNEDELQKEKEEKGKDLEEDEDEEEGDKDEEEGDFGDETKDKSGKITGEEKIVEEKSRKKEKAAEEKKADHEEL